MTLIAMVAAVALSYTVTSGLVPASTTGPSGVYISDGGPNPLIDGIDWDEWFDSYGLSFQDYLDSMELTFEEWILIDGIDWDEWFDAYNTNKPPPIIPPPI